ncbi:MULTISPECIES: Dabb family protein [Marinomonas]|uniref:Dabb family protein n=1 Tax=Marinomonas rhodophyticola TaxID=2992803 RepID=A0ABT3KJW9_9GAMM|nr:Dabb family protein [Marinomonas sp. KJ51-3]MCW4630838.1 Dabb family protein [Marinomonas sp. KJ51-3]
MIRHVLFIKFKADATAEAISRCFNHFDSIKSKIAGIEAVEWGVNMSKEGLNKDYSHCVFMTFVDDAALDHYIPHPDHDALKAQLVPILEDIIVFDYAL